MIPYHWHRCPGLELPLTFIIKEHRRHLYPCHKPKCSHSYNRYCGIIVDAVLEHKYGPSKKPRRDSFVTKILKKEYL